MMRKSDHLVGDSLKKGIILKALSGFYYVEDLQSKEMIQCRSRGLFRKKKITPLVGDTVEKTSWFARPLRTWILL